MTVYKDIEDRILRQFNSSTKQSLSDIGSDEEEKNKIIYNISGSNNSRIPELRVDYSDFVNHIFFGSAYSSVNFALNRLKDFPLDGELKDINDWKDINSGYENWFYDNFPKDHGNLFLTSGSNGPFVYVKDFERKIVLGTGSFTIEAFIKPYENIAESSQSYPIVSILASSSGHGIGTCAFLQKVNDVKYISLSLFSGATGPHTVSFPYDTYISAAHFISLVYSSGTTSFGKFYVDGELISSASFTSVPSSIEFGVKSVEVGHSFLPTGSISNFVRNYYSGSIDDLRIWSGERKDSLIKRNFYRPIYANHSSSLNLYYKFNEFWLTSSNKCFDYSGNQLYGNFSGTFNTAIQCSTGTLSSLFQDPGDIILNFTNTDVESFVDIQRESGSLYDDQNSNYIFRLVPQFMVEEDTDNNYKLFLLLLSRHWDRLKLFIQHLSNFNKINQANFNDTPNEFLNEVGRHYGIDLGGIYEDSSPLQFFFGEDILSTGSIENSLEDVRNQTKRNILNNLIFLYKTKSTRECLDSAIRCLGLNDSIVNINEYSIFSGGITTNFEPKTTEKRVLRFFKDLNQYVSLTSASYSPVEPKTYQFRFMVNSGSYTGSAAPLTSSLFRTEVGNSGSRFFYCDLYRENISSSLMKVVLFHSASSASPITSSYFNALNNNWINLSIYRDFPSANNLFGLDVLSMDFDEILFHDSNNGTLDSAYNPTSNINIILGSVSGSPFYGNIQEFRVWNKILTSSHILERHTLDFQSVALENFIPDLLSNKLMIHLKLDDFTGSNSGIVQAHDYINNDTNSYFVGLSSSNEWNFPGNYIRRLEPAYSYDFGINNDKIRIKNNDKFTKNDVNQDIQFLSVDFSPVSQLNKEIIKWFGDLENFSNIIGFPYLKYRDEVQLMNLYSSNFFASRVNSSGIDFSVYLDIIKWFDTNFTYFLSQLIPLDLVSSLSNYVVEPTLFEYNKVKYIFPQQQNQQQYSLEASRSIVPNLTAVPYGQDVDLTDPGRFGAAVSASANISQDVLFSASISASNNFNFNNLAYKNVLNDYFQTNSGNFSPPGYGNGFYTMMITGANHLYNTYNAIINFNLTGVHAVGVAGINTLYNSSSQGRPENLHFTGTFAGITDARWFWTGRPNGGTTEPSSRHDIGIGYGGGFGQLLTINQKSILGNPITAVAQSTNILIPGRNSRFNLAKVPKWINIERDTSDLETVFLWPLLSNHESYNGTRIIFNNGSSNCFFENGTPANSFGNAINIEGYNALNFQVVGNWSVVSTTPVLSLFVRFQFFDKEVPGEVGFESVLSSSFLPTTGSITTPIPHGYLVPIDTTDILGSGGGKATVKFGQFAGGFERSLPKNKYMRVFIELGAVSSANGQFNILIKGILSKAPVNDDIIKILRFS